MATQSIQTVAGMVIPDTALVREVTDFIRDAEDDLLFDHSRRVFLFGALQGRRRGLQPDLELLYAGGDVPRPGPHRALPHVSAALRNRRRQRGPRLPVGARGRRRRAPQGLAEHRAAHHPGSAEFLEPEIALVNAGVETDVVGIGRDELSSEALAAVTAAHPRPDFKRRILAAFNDGMKHRPRQHLRHHERRRAGALRPHIRPRRLRRHDPRQHLARIASRPMRFVVDMTGSDASRMSVPAGKPHHRAHDGQ